MHAQIALVGRLMFDPETKFQESGNSKTGLKVSVNHGGRKPEGQQYPTSDIYSCEVWGKRGETAANFLKKNDRVFVTGRLEVNEHQGKTYLNVRDAEWAFTGSKRAEGEGVPSPDELPF